MAKKGILCKCGRRMNKTSDMCYRCKKLESDKNLYSTPDVPLTNEEKTGLEKLRRIYDPRIGIEEYFQKAYDSIS